jgi:hypothetical protein
MLGSSAASVSSFIPMSFTSVGFDFSGSSFISMSLLVCFSASAVSDFLFLFGLSS